MSWGGSNIRPEATGYGAVYFANNTLSDKGESLEGRKCAVSGSGNVALFCVEKLLEVGAMPVSLSDSNGSIVVPSGLT